MATTPNNKPAEGDPDTMDILAHHMAETAAVVIYGELQRLFALTDEKAKKRDETPSVTVGVDAPRRPANEGLSYGARLMAHLDWTGSTQGRPLH